MLVIGVVGGIASGKTLVTQLLQTHGATVIDADQAGHMVLEHSDVRQALGQQFGDEIFTTDDQIDRRALARLVFAPAPEGPAKLALLEQLTHPRIGAMLEQQIAAARQAGAPAVVLDAAVMLKAGWRRLCDHVIFVDCPRPLRLARATARGWNEAEFTEREAAQTSLDVKRRAADIVIDNSQTEIDTERQVTVLWDRLLSHSKHL